MVGGGKDVRAGANAAARAVHQAAAGGGGGGAQDLPLGAAGGNAAPAEAAAALRAGAAVVAGPAGSEDIGSQSSESEGSDEEGGEEYWFSEEEGGEAAGEWLDGGGGDSDGEDSSDWSGEEWDDEEGFEGWGADGMESESSDEPAAEEQAAVRLVEETAGRHVECGWAAYAVPTIAHHFQSADALAVVSLPPPPTSSSSGGSKAIRSGSFGVLAATFDVHGVAAWLLPPAGAMHSLGSTSLPAAVRLGGFQAPRDIYSMALSPDGRYMATGGESGMLTLYSVDPTAPCRPELASGPLTLPGLNYFYTPLLLPHQLVRQQQLQRQRQQQQQQQQDEVPPGHQQQQQEQQQQDQWQLLAEQAEVQEELARYADPELPGEMPAADVPADQHPARQLARDVLAMTDRLQRDTRKLRQQAQQMQVEIDGQGGAQLPPGFLSGQQHQDQQLLPGCLPGWYAAALESGQRASLATDLEQTQRYLQAVMGQDLSSLGLGMAVQAGQQQQQQPGAPDQQQQQQHVLPEGVHAQLMEQMCSALQSAAGAARLLGAVGDFANGSAAAQARELAAATAAGAAAQAAAAAAELAARAVNASGVCEPLHPAALTPVAAAAAAATAVGGSAAWEAAAASLRQQQQQGQQQQAAAGHGKGKQPLLEAQQQGQQRQRQQQQQQEGEGRELPPPHAAVMMRGMVALGLEPGQAQQVLFVPDGMCNGVRFGLVAGKQRLLAADQSCYVYVFDLPEPQPAAAAAVGAAGAAVTAAPAGAAASSSSRPASSSSRGRAAAVDSGELHPEQLMCAGLGGQQRQQQQSKHWRMRPVNFLGPVQHAMGAQITHQQITHQQITHQQPKPGAEAAPAPAAGTAAAPAPGCTSSSSSSSSSSYLTAALGPFPWPCNLAAASPDGRWIAVVGDSQCVALVDQHAGFSWRQLDFDLAGGREDVEAGLEAGSQYAAWNASSSLVAVTSDALHAVFVFEAGSGRMVMRVEGHRRACLSVGFAPWDDRLLVYAEESKHVHLRRVPEASGSSSGAGASSSGGGGGGSRRGGAAGCSEQNARDDLADAGPGIQLLRLPIIPVLGAPAELDGGSRRRRVTGMALTQQGDLVLATKQGVVLRFLSSQPWSPDTHAHWPVAYREAMRTLLLCAHRQQHGGAQRGGEGGSGHGGGSAATAGLWALPLPLLQHIMSVVAGRRTDWLQQEEPAAAAAAAVDAAAGDGPEDAAAAVAAGEQQ